MGSFRLSSIAISFCAAIHGVALGADAGNGGPRREPLPLRRVEVTDSFWAPRLEVIRRRSIPHSWQYVEGEIRALRRAAGEQVEGEANGTWGEANLYKVLETCAHSLSIWSDPELEKRVDAIAGLLRRSQRPDGYLHAYVTNAGLPPWNPEFLDGSHDGYVLGHLIEAALEFREATGKETLLDVARRAADQAHAHFIGPPGSPGFCGHAELEMALAELHRVTGESRYLDLARAFVEWRGRGVVKPCSGTPRAYFQDEAPLRRQRSLDGHAVRAVFFATGVADLAIETGDLDYRLAANRFFESAAGRRMYVTGSVGPRKEHEAFGEDYELPLDGYCESCAACGLADLAHRMFLLEGDSGAADVLERVLHNAVLHGLSLDGTSSYYRNPPNDRDHPRDNCWVCCPPNLTRTILQVGRYAYAHRGNEVWVNLFVGGRARFPLAAGEAVLAVRSSLPWEGRVEIRIEAAPPSILAVNLRNPSWCTRATLRLGDAEVTPLPLAETGYIRIEREWREGDRILLDLEMPVLRMVAHPAIAACAGRVALQRGPLVYGFEGIDNGGEGGIELGPEPGFRVEPAAGLLGGIAVIRGKAADGRPVAAIPFHVLANRDRTWQEVWVRQRGLAGGDRWWLGKLYRPVETEKP